MQPPKPPNIAGVEVVPAQSDQADSMALTHLSALPGRSLPQVIYVVKVKLKSKPPVTSLAWGLYVKDVRIPKYWEYEDGIYFTVIDPEFFAEHKGERLRFSHDGVEFHDTGVKVPGVPASTTPVATVSAALVSTARAATKPTRRAKARRAKAQPTSTRKARR